MSDYEKMFQKKKESAGSCPSAMTGYMVGQYRVTWQYRHHYNSKSNAIRVKTGEYFGKIKHTIRYNGEQLAIVLFDGNKRISKVPMSELKRII